MEYDRYRFNKKEIGILIVQWLGICVVFAYFFYRSVWAFIVMLLFFPLFIKLRRAQRMKERKWNLTLAFREAVVMVAGNLQAGNSVENAFRRSYEDLRDLYGEEADISKEFRVISRGMDSNLMIENLLRDLGDRSGVEDIVDFSEIFSAAKRSGGNLREMISDTAQAISDKTEIKRELRIMISEKQLEQKIMSFIPFLILMYLGFTSPGYFDSMYHTMPGIGVMSGCLIAYIGALLWGMKITAIEV